MFASFYLWLSTRKGGVTHMKKAIIALTIAFAFLATSSSVFAADDQASPAAPAPTATAKPKLSFDDIKAKQLERNEKEMAKLKEMHECIEKAQNPAELKACHPKRSHHHHKKAAK
jgi:hypothetical protein